MTAQPRRKPRRVVLGHCAAYLGNDGGLRVYGGQAEGCLFSVEFSKAKRIHSKTGKLIWEPDPPKAKR